MLFHHQILSLLRSIKSNSVTRRSFRAATIPRRLPLERLASQFPPFISTRIDCFGQFYVTVRLTVEKTWGFLFTCLTSCALHIEIGQSLGANKCVMGIEPSAPSRRVPRMILV